MNQPQESGERLPDQIWIARRAGLLFPVSSEQGATDANADAQFYVRADQAQARVEELKADRDSAVECADRRLERAEKAEQTIAEVKKRFRYIMGEDIAGMEAHMLADEVAAEALDLLRGEGET